MRLHFFNSAVIANSKLNFRPQTASFSLTLSAVMQISWKKKSGIPTRFVLTNMATLLSLETIYISVERHFCYFHCFNQDPVGGLLERISTSFTANDKREFVPLDQVFPLIVFFLSFTVHYNYRKIGNFTPILSITIVLSCFYLLISHFGHFST